MPPCVCFWQKMTMRESLVKIAGIDEATLQDEEAVIKLARAKGIELDDQAGAGKAETELFELLVEDKLINPNRRP